MPDTFFDEIDDQFPSVRIIESTDDVDHIVSNIAPEQLVQRTSYLKRLIEEFPPEITDEELLQRVLGIDGEGSGIDADKVKGLDADFSCSHTQNGYQKIPGGLIFQWGRVNDISARARAGNFYHGTVEWVFPIAFPNSCFVAVPIGVNSTAALEFGAHRGAVSNASVTFFPLLDSPSNTDLDFFAVGY